MYEKFISRERKVLNILQQFMDNDLEFVTVGGFAVAAYKHRFSVDADIVVREQDFPKFKAILEKNKFRQTITKKLDSTYAPVFMRYELKADLPVHIDVLLNAVAVRQTGASFSFELLKKHSKKRKIIGSEEEVCVIVPDKEILIALKLHAGRLTDFRDIAALCKRVNINIVKSVISRGNKKILRRHINKLLSLITKKSFLDSFKGVFAEKKYGVDVECVKRLKKVLESPK